MTRRMGKRSSMAMGERGERGVCVGIFTLTAQACDVVGEKGKVSVVSVRGLPSLKKKKNILYRE